MTLGRWDLKAVTGFIVLGCNVGIYNLYLYELFYGSWECREAKALYYMVTAIVIAYIGYDTIKGYSTILHLQSNICILAALFINFIFFALTLYDILPNHRLYLYGFNGMILAATIAILLIGVKYEIFKI